MSSSIADTARNVASDMNGKASKVETEIENLSRDAGKKVGHFASSLLDSTNQAKQSGQDYLRENPVTSMAIAAGIGLLCGSLLTFSLRRRS